MMKRIFLLLATTMTLTGCGWAGKTVKVDIADSAFGISTRGYSNADKITYRAKNRFEVSAKLDFEVGNDTEFRIMLDPKQGNDDVVITFTGVSGELPGGAGGTAKSLGREKIIVLCVPDVPKGTKYKFDIDVAGIGTLGSIDPRLDVTW
jgi:hypothetical protein